jgi:ankyrin repeat protein
VSEDQVFREEELRAAASAGDASGVRQLLQAGVDPNTFDEAGLAALHHAAEKEHLEIVSLLLEHGADVNAQDSRRLGNTPLGEVAATCSVAMAQLLVEAGANPTLRGWMQLSALDHSRGRKRGDGPRVHELLVRAAQRWEPGAR